MIDRIEATYNDDMDRDRRRMAFTPEAREDLLRRISEVLRSCVGVSAAWLHGSFVRGEAARDIDIALLVAPGADPAATAEKAGLSLEREAAAGIQYDVRPMSLEDPVTFRHQVLREGRIIVEADPDARVTFWVETVREYLDLAPLLRRGRRSMVARLAHGA